MSQRHRECGTRSERYSDAVRLMKSPDRSERPRPFSTVGRRLSSSVPLEPADADPGEYEDVAEARQQRERVAAVPGAEVEDPGEERHHGSDRSPARDRAPEAA